MDETEFRIGGCAGRIVINFLNTKAVYLADPDNRESLTSVETICADSTSIPPILILKGEALSEKYFDNHLHDQNLLATSSSGYTNDALALKYLIHFHNKCTIIWKARVNFSTSTAMVHVDDDFISYCWQHEIIPLQLPPHSTHLLQPLHIGMFQPLKHWHQEDTHQ